MPGWIVRPTPQTKPGMLGAKFLSPSKSHPNGKTSDVKSHNYKAHQLAFQFFTIEYEKSVKDYQIFRIFSILDIYQIEQQKET